MGVTLGDSVHPGRGPQAGVEGLRFDSARCAGDACHEPWRRALREWIKFLGVAIATGVLLIANPALAWGPLGHRIVARLAEAQLTPTARAEMDRLLHEQGARHLSDIAAWADDLRDTDPALFRQTSRLHFVNFHSRDCIYDPPRDCRDGECVVAAITHYATILGDRSRPDAQRAQALDFVVHFVADVHQPLHASSSDDAGGNDYQVRWHDRGSNLHRVWDSLMLDDAHLSAARYARLLADDPTPADSGGTPVQWAEESCRIARGVYPPARTMTQAYVERERPVAEQRLRQAGARLAALLNRELAN